ncbi:MAG TPA: phosphatidate cytidylyltransferase [Alphaproteobacteria bacterium]|nr:phosphatidate cytidylyltransferase [Alphaproteobacteria bacterium]
MKRVLTAVVLVPVVLLIVFKAPLWLFALVVAGIIVLALHEYLGIAKAAELKPILWLTYIMAVLPFVMLWVTGWPAEPSYPKVDFSLLFLPGWLPVFLAAIVFGVPLVFRKDLRMGLASVGASVFGLIYIAVPLSLLVCLRGDLSTKILVIFVLFSVWAGDIAAYYVGRSLGKHKLAPVVSPNKSWEGAIASVFASVAVALLVFRFQPQINKLFLVAPWAQQAAWVHVVALAIITNIAAQFGDLFESALKRGAGVKDSGSLLPGHGGILDRIDALLFAIPVVWYYAQLSGFLNPEIHQ